MSAKHRVTVNLEDLEYEELSALSRKNRVSLAWLGRQAITEFLDRYAHDRRQLPLNLPERGARQDDGTAGDRKAAGGTDHPGRRAD